MLRNFLEKKFAGNLIFWLCCGLSYSLIVVVGAIFFSDSKGASPDKLLFDLTGKIDTKFVVIIFVAMALSTVLGAVVQMLLKKTMGGFEIGLLSIESAYGQFVSFGSISFTMVFLKFFYQWVTVKKPNLIDIDLSLVISAFVYWLVAFFIYSVVETLKKSLPVNKP